MGVGQNTELTKKLKAALRAKLDELGVLIDDELPEYIMVLIANKKEKSQMKNDLNLFLGSSTSKFCDWLFDLLDRLSKPGNLTDDTTKDKDHKDVAHSSASSNHKDREKKSDEHRRDRKDSRDDVRDKEKLRQLEKEREREKVREDDRRHAVEKERERELKEKEERQRSRDAAMKERENKKKIYVAPSRRNDERDRERASSNARMAKRRSRSRSKTWSDDEFDQKIAHNNRLSTKKVIPSLVTRAPKEESPEPEPVKVSSQVVVKRKIQPVVDEKSMKGRSNMFMKAMSEASASAGYGAPVVSPSKNHTTNVVDPAHQKKPVLSSTSAVRSPMKGRLTVPKGRKIVAESDDEDYDSDNVVNTTVEDNGLGPKITVTLKGAKEHIKSMEANHKSKLAMKRKRDDSVANAGPSEKKKINVDTADDSRHDRNSPTMRKWDGQIMIDEDSDDRESDDEAEIDAVLASAQKVTCRTFSHTHSVDDDILPPTQHLSRGDSYMGYSPTISLNQQAPSMMLQQMPVYVPTPVNLPPGVVQYSAQVENQSPTMDTGVGKQVERCHFWPSCRQGDACQYAHPNKACKNFPNCTFGKRCLYIHPPCKFGFSCMNQSCNYTHGGKVLKPIVSQNQHGFTTASTTVVKLEPKIEPDVPLATPPSAPMPIDGSLAQSIPCRFSGGCTRVGCTFKHPPACRFGSGCFNQSCYFYHVPGAAAAPVAAAAPAPATRASDFKWKSAAAPKAPVT